MAVKNDLKKLRKEQRLKQQLNEEFAELLSKKKEAYREYRKAKQEMTDFATAKYDIERFLNLEKEEETSKKEKAKSKEEAL